MSETPAVMVTLRADANQMDNTGYAWAFLDVANEPGRARPRAVIVAGDETEPVRARGVDQVDGPGGRRVVHLDVLGVPEEVVDELRHAKVIV
jgi:hypothetical protein